MDLHRFFILSASAQGDRAEVRMARLRTRVSGPAAALAVIHRPWLRLLRSVTRTMLQWSLRSVLVGRAMRTITVSQAATRLSITERPEDLFFYARKAVVVDWDQI